MFSGQIVPRLFRGRNKSLARNGGMKRKSRVWSLCDTGRSIMCRMCRNGSIQGASLLVCRMLCTRGPVKKSRRVQPSIPNSGPRCSCLRCYSYIAGSVTSPPGRVRLSRRRRKRTLQRPRSDHVYKSNEWSRQPRGRRSSARSSIVSIGRINRQGSPNFIRVASQVTISNSTRLTRTGRVSVSGSVITTTPKQ